MCRNFDRDALGVRQNQAVSEATTDSAAATSNGNDGTPIKKGAIVKAEVLPAHRGIQSSATELPLPVLGYACLNCTLRHQKPTFFNNRTCRLATMKDPAKGISFVSGLALQNCRDLLPILKWNVAHGIKFMRLSSEFFPWGNVHYKLCDLPDYEGIQKALAEAGEFARESDHRLTSHPSEFVKLAGQTEELVNKSIADLELHSEMFDLLGYDASVWKHWNKINIHVGGTYGDKGAALTRFAANFKRLSPSCQLRLTVENDDRASMFSVADLKELHEMTGCKLPIVFDFHHHRFCTGDQSTEEALRSAMSTWPPGVRPVAHWSESQGGKKEHAHSDYIGQTGRMDLFGLDAHIDVMIESKAKELSLLLYRDIVEHGNGGRDQFFVSIDAIEEEAARVEALKAGGKPVELDPVQGVELEGVEIIPCNDKRLHGRSQRRNKLQRKVATTAAKALKAEMDSATGENSDTVTQKAKHTCMSAKSARSHAKGPAAATKAATEQSSAMSSQPPTDDSLHAAAEAPLSRPDASASTPSAGGSSKRKRALSNSVQAKAAAALADAEATAANGDVIMPLPCEAEAAVPADGPAADSTTKRKSSTAVAKRKQSRSIAVEATAEASDDVEAPVGNLLAPSVHEAERAAATGMLGIIETVETSSKQVERLPAKPQGKRVPSKKVQAQAAASLAEAESAAGSSFAVPSPGLAQAAVAAGAQAKTRASRDTIAVSTMAVDTQPVAKSRRIRSAAAVVATDATSKAQADQPHLPQTVADNVHPGTDDHDNGERSRQPASKGSQTRAAARASVAVSDRAAADAAERRTRQTSRKKSSQQL